MNQRLLLLAVVAAVLPGPVLGQGTAARDNIDALIEEQAKANGVPASFVHQVVKRESNYNPNARGGSALGLMQIKHATARGLGYRGDAAGLYDPKINLRYGIAYLAGAYRTARGNIHQAYTYYNRGYYYAGKRQGTLVAGIEETTTASPQSGVAFGDVFTRGFDGQRKAQPDANVIAAGTALAYAPSLTATPMPTELVEVPLPPRRPAALSGLAPAVAEIGPAHAPAITPQATALAALSVDPAAPRTAAGAASGEMTQTETVEVPLPPRRPSAVVLAAVGRPIVARKAPTPGTIMEASALPPSQ
ncbi:transglycosylase SLT domain-containing protein [Methylobacterium sp. E-045]|uniref:transglycosylase SLT domain-containing protein n=1 Tax=Methylobacterium sp. E-045 TaxID=2836575 RepID=UPI001FBB1915|nr:transglycosylase SLT domain-containing protein [Methylobacterium sp. E-045]MCJ2130250.1 transglycosylase SLT domain-containing protein [Methylobacterium sp. E-045]